MPVRRISLLLALSAPLWFVARPAGQAAAAPRPAAAARALPRTADGKPNFQGIWQARNAASYDLQDPAARSGMPAGMGVVDGREIPYQPWAAAKKAENYAHRQTADPLAKCFMP